MTYTVQADGVVKSYGRTVALDGVDLFAGTGVAGLLGPNGAGKSTLLRIVATVLAPTAGRLQLLGRNPRHRNDRVEIRRRLGYLPQEPGYYRSFTAFEFVDYIAILKEMTHRQARHDEVWRVLEQVDLTNFARRKVRKLSGGMRRRLGLAQALLGEPELLVLDEPSAGMDPEQRLRFRDHISALAQDRAVLVATHLTEDVAALCQSVTVLNHGRALFTGPTEALTSRAEGRVWMSEAREPAATVSWRTAQGRHRNIGQPPSDADLIQPQLEDAYLLLLAESDQDTRGMVA